MKHSLKVNPNYTSTFVFTNDYPALLEDVPSPPESEDPLFQISAAKGTCRVMCFHPKSNVTISLMTVSEIVNIINGLVVCTRDTYLQYIFLEMFVQKLCNCTI